MATSSGSASLHVVRWSSFFQGMIMCLCAGTLYMWSAYAKTIKDKMNWDQSEINLVYSLGSIGQYLGFPPGVLFDRKGPKWGSAYSACFIFFGYFMMYLQLEHRFSDSAALMGLFYAFAGQGCIGLYMPALLTNVRNFPAINRGVVVGVLASAFGLSAFVWTSIWGIFRDDKDIEKFLLIMALTFGGVGIVGTLVLSLLDADVVNVQSESKAPLMADTDAKPEKKVDVGEILSGHKIVTNVDFILLFTLFGLGTGTGLMFIGNVSTMANSWDQDGQLMVKMLSFANCLGRLIIGAASDFAKSKNPVLDRPYFIVIAVAFMLLTHAVMIGAQEGFLFTAAIFNGLAYGALFSIVPTFLSDRFGAPGFGFNWGLTTLALAIGNVAMSYSAGAMYDTHAYTDDSGEKVCKGMECYQSAFVMTTACGTVALALSIVLAIRHRRRLDEAMQYQRFY